MSKLQSTLNPRFTDSATAQMTTSVRKSFKKLFSSSNNPEKEENLVSHPITSGNNHATEFVTLASSLSQKRKNGTDSLLSSSPSPTPDIAKNQKYTTIPDQNSKIVSTVSKLNQKTVQKWTQLLKKVEKEQMSQLKNLDKSLISLKKKEKSVLMAENADANATTVGRSDVLSVETTARILSSREARVDREVDKKVEAKRDSETVKIATNKIQRMEQLVEKLYTKTVNRQREEFCRIKEKYGI